MYSNLYYVSLDEIEMDEYTSVDEIIIDENACLFNLYVDEIDDVDYDELDEELDRFEGGAFTRDENKIVVKSKTAYFKDKYARLKEKLDEFQSTLTLDTFSSSKFIGDWVEAKHYAESMFGEWVIYDDEYLPFDEFVRMYLKDGDSFYIGQVFEIHTCFIILAIKH